MELEAAGLGAGDTVMVEMELRIHRGISNERPYLVQTPVKLNTLAPGVVTQRKLEIEYNFFRLEVPFTVIRRQSGALTNRSEGPGRTGY
jgi:hypothetical protein